MTSGDLVRTPLGPGVVREVRNRRVLVAIQGRTVLVDLDAVTPIAGDSKAGRRTRRLAEASLASGSVPPRGGDRDTTVSPRATHHLDLHGLSIEAALTRLDQALDAAIRADAAEVHILHGKGTGRLRDAVHRHLRALSVVRHARLDPSNAGLTIAVL